jgi:transcription elongation GreA/GreB family factor
MSGDSDGLEREIDFVDAPLGLRARDVRIELLVRDSARFSCRTQNDTEGRSIFGRINLLTDGAQAEGLVIKAWFSDAPFNNRIAVQVRFKLPDGSTGECTDRMLWVADVGLLSEGSVVPVRYDPSKHSRVAIDVPALKERHAPVKARVEAEREARLDAQLEHLGAGEAGDDAPSGETTGQSIRARITYREVASGETKTQTIVSDDADIFERSHGEARETSQIGMALLGGAAGDRVMLPTGIGKPPIEVDIVAIDESRT